MQRFKLVIMTGNTELAILSYDELDSNTHEPLTSDEKAQLNRIPGAQLNPDTDLDFTVDLVLDNPTAGEMERVIGEVKQILGTGRVDPATL